MPIKFSKDWYNLMYIPLVTKTQFESQSFNKMTGTRCNLSSGQC